MSLPPPAAGPLGRTLHSLRRACRTHLPRRRPPFYVLVMGLALAGLLLLLLLNTLLAQSAFSVHDLQKRNRELAVVEQDLQQQLDAKTKPAGLAAEAERLGMARNPAPLFLDLRTGRVTGLGPKPSVIPAPPVGALDGKPGDVFVVPNALPVEQTVAPTPISSSPAPSVPASPSPVPHPAP